MKKRKITSLASMFLLMLSFLLTSCGKSDMAAAPSSSVQPRYSKNSAVEIQFSEKMAAESP